MKSMNPMQMSAADGAEAIVKDGDIKTFARDVLHASREAPVLVDFWAPWCGPCKQLTPTLEKVVKAAGGKIRLVKINIDDNPELAQQLRIQSVPTVYAFVNGQPVTGFTGAQPESQIRALVERLVGPLGPAPIEERLEEAQMLAEAGDTEAAIAQFRNLLEEEPGQPDAAGGLARCLLTGGSLDEADEVLRGVPREHANHVAVSGAQAALSLAREAGELGDPQALAARLRANGDDQDARLRLATSMFLGGRIEPAIDELIAMVKQDRAWEDEAARRRLVKFFDVLGPRHPATVQGRRQLSTVLFS